MACEVIAVQISPFTEARFWRKVAKIWHKFQENGTKKNQISENGGERKKNPSANPASPYRIN